MGRGERIFLCIHLCHNVFVRETNDETVLWRVVLVLVLYNQALAGVVVRLTLTAPAVLHLEALEVSAVLNNLDETLLERRIGSQNRLSI